MVLPCIGSQAQTTCRPSLCTARTRGVSLASTASCPMRAITVILPGSLWRVEPVDEGEQAIRLEAGTGLEPDGVADTAQEVDVGAVRLARAIADPEHVRAAVVPAASGGIDTGQRLLVLEEQSLVGGVELGLPDSAARSPR